MTTAVSGSADVSVPQANTGLLGDAGFMVNVPWGQPAQASLATASALSSCRVARSPVLTNPHLDYRWARSAAASPRLLELVTRILGPHVAIEGSCLAAKASGEHYVEEAAVAGRNKTLQLDPDRSVAAWLALSDARVRSGSLEVCPGSHLCNPSTAARTAVDDQDAFLPLTMRAGRAALLDVRLVHRSAPNEFAFYPRVAMSVRFVAPGAILRRSDSAPAPLPVAGERQAWPARELRDRVRPDA